MSYSTVRLPGFKKCIYVVFCKNKLQNFSLLPVTRNNLCISARKQDFEKIFVCVIDIRIIRIDAREVIIFVFLQNTVL